MFWVLMRFVRLVCYIRECCFPTGFHHLCDVIQFLRKRYVSMAMRCSCHLKTSIFEPVCENTTLIGKCSYWNFILPNCHLSKFCRDKVDFWFGVSVQSNEVWRQSWPWTLGKSSLKIESENPDVFILYCWLFTKNSSIYVNVIWYLQMQRVRFCRNC